MDQSTPKPDILLAAPVQYWTDRIIRVRCPFCNKLHGHAFSGYESRETVRVKHCDRRNGPSEYRMIFPFDALTGKTQYEIDKDSGAFVTLGADPPHVQRKASEESGHRDVADEAESGSESDPVSEPKSWEHATETITSDWCHPNSTPWLRQLWLGRGGGEPMTMRVIDLVVSTMLIDGHETYLRSYLETSKDAQVFLHGVDVLGKTTLLLAAAERYSHVVRLLLEKGSDKEARDLDGRTPLMEAALWGRLENVEALLQAGADKVARDRKGLRALDFAKPSERNDHERYWRAGGEAQVYKENIYEANRDRKVIVRLLQAGDEAKPSFATDSTDRDNLAYHHFVDSPSDGSKKLVGLLQSFPVRNKWKTVAVLMREEPYPAINAVSGWSDAGLSTYVAGRCYTDEVLRIAEALKYMIPEDHRDQGTAGQYYACHAEKQLIAYFVSKHAWLPGTAESAERLREIRPPVELRRAQILVSAEVCLDCKRFCERVSACLGINVHVGRR